MDEAVGLAAELLDRWAPIMIEISLVTGNRGRFEVTLDGQLIFSKAQSKRLPEKDEIVKLAEPVLGPPIDWR